MTNERGEEKEEKRRAEERREREDVNLKKLAILRLNGLV